MSLLALERVKKVFGGLSAVRDLDLAIEPGSIFGLIGPNGAGKTTIFNVITGVYKPDGGRIRFDGEEIGGWAPAAVAARGIARTFQNIRLFRTMTVEENVMVAGHHLHKAGVLSAILRNARHAADEARSQEAERRAARAHEPARARRSSPARCRTARSGASRSRALMLKPKLLLLDEPAAGMNSQEAGELNRQIRRLRDELEVTVVLVEHNMSVVMGVCERIHVVDHGETIAEGPPEAIRAHPKVLAAYLGEGAAASLVPPS